ncbi:hypothetical protein L1887_53023 [Cichorium endivia]|nr:hypothetical protein L1887_53023 [Cichorium endivia]
MVKVFGVLRQCWCRADTGGAPWMARLSATGSWEAVRPGGDGEGSREAAADEIACCGRRSLFLLEQQGSRNVNSSRVATKQTLAAGGRRRARHGLQRS